MALYFSVLLYSGAQMEALRTVMVFTVAVGFAKTINFNYIHKPCSRVHFIWVSDSWFLVLVSASQLNLMITTSKI